MVEDAAVTIQNAIAERRRSLIAKLRQLAQLEVRSMKATNFTTMLNLEEHQSSADP
jgi:hypothetical protein